MGPLSQSLKSIISNDTFLKIREISKKLWNLYSNFDFKLLLGISGLGILTRYFSNTFISSYTCGSAIHVIKSQVKELFGIKNAIRFSGIMNIPRVRKFNFTLITFFHSINSNYNWLIIFIKSLVDLGYKMTDANWQTVVISVISIIYLVIFKEYLNPWIKRKTKMTLPSDLFLVR